MADHNPHADLIAALGALTNIHKTGDVQAGQRRYRYVELDELLDAARPILLANRLVLTQDVATDDTGHLAVTTILWHASGERFTFGPLRSHQPDNPQALGSIITYWRRYSAMAALGVAGADDDAQNAVRQPRNTPARDREAHAQTRPVERTQATPDDPANQPFETPVHEPGTASGDLPATDKQRGALYGRLTKMGIPKEKQRPYLHNLLAQKRGVEYGSDYHLTRRDASLLLDELAMIQDLGKPAPQEPPEDRE